MIGILRSESIMVTSAWLLLLLLLLPTSSLTLSFCNPVQADFNNTVTEQTHRAGKQHDTDCVFRA